MLGVEKLIRKVKKLAKEGRNEESITNNVIANYDVSKLLDEFCVVETGNVFDDVKQVVLEILAIQY